MPISDGYGPMMGMPYGHMGLGMVIAALMVLAVGFGVGYAVGRSR